MSEDTREEIAGESLKQAQGMAAGISIIGSDRNEAALAPQDITTYDKKSGIIARSNVDARGEYDHPPHTGALRESEVIANYKDRIRELEKCCHNQMLLALEFEKKYQECQLSRISAEFKAVYEKESNVKSDDSGQLELSSYKNRNLSLLADNRNLLSKVDRLLLEKENLSRELFETKNKLVNTQDQLEKISRYKQYSELTGISSDSILNKLVETTKSLSDSIEQNKLLHEALKSAKGHILMQNDSLSKSVNSKLMREEASIKDDARLQAVRLAKDLHETRQMARKEQELMVMAISVLYEKLTSSKKIS